VNCLAGKLSAEAAVEPLKLSCAPGAILGALAERSGPAVLESTALHESYGRYTILGCCPLEVLTLRDNILTNAAGEVLAKGRRLWQALKAAFARVKLAARPAGVGYLPGWIGYIGYEVGRLIERLPGAAVRDTDLPDMHLAFYDSLLVYDAVEKRWHLVRLAFDNPPPGAGRAAAELKEIAAGAGPAAPEHLPAPAENADARTRAEAAVGASNFKPDEYRQAVARCKEYISAGDIFQVNLSQRFVFDNAPEPLAIYLALRRRNPAWYAAYLSFESQGRRCAVLSSSPELFLRVRGDRVITRPIKGTRPRVGDDRADAAAKADLLSSPKDNAELAMIIDLLRNDLGRVCRYGTVRVADRRTLETHPTVFHLVGTVEGRLCDGVGPAELLKAAFPGGSITGAPKIRAMEIIDELEGAARNVYTGCIGHVGVDGSCEWNIAIRTIVWDDWRAYVQVGGGIVADSSPQDEYNETLDKARAMTEALGSAAAAMQMARK
jgi:para-aminobenzoate synthetase component 1